MSKNAKSPLSRSCAPAIYGAALNSVDPSAALQKAISLQGLSLQVCDSTVDLTAGLHSIYSIAIGKAAWPMAGALESILGDRLTAGLISAPSPETPQINIPRCAHLPRSNRAESHTRVCSLPAERWQVFAGGHPLPNQQSLDAARAAFDLLRRADDERALIIFLISGGGSAMLEWPADEAITLDDLRQANQTLVDSGLPIAEINVVRRSFSSVKGNKLASRAPRARQLTIIVSDTPEGDEASVASGPTLQPPPGPSADEIINRCNLNARLPPSILKAIELGSDQNAREHERQEHYALLNNRTALDAAAAAARQHGFLVELASDISDQPIELGCEALIARLLHIRERLTGEGQIACLVSGGEFSCPVRGRGTGGRNCETVLRLALQLDGLNKEAARSRKIRATILSAGTDGIDGNSPATGAIADETTISRAFASGLEAERFLRNSDSFSYFKALGDAIVTGPSGTNVRDIRLMFVTH